VVLQECLGTRTNSSFESKGKKGPKRGENAVKGTDMIATEEKVRKASSTKKGERKKSQSWLEEARPEEVNFYQGEVGGAIRAPTASRFRFNKSKALLFGDLSSDLKV